MQPGEDGPEPALDVRFGPVGLVQVRLRRLDPDDVFAELTARMLSAPRFFDHTAVAADLSALDELPPAEAVRGVIAAIRRTGLMPIGLAHATQSPEAIARELGLPVLAPFRAGTRHSRAVAKPPDAPVVPAPPVPVRPPAGRYVSIAEQKAALGSSALASLAGLDAAAASGGMDAERAPARAGDEGAGANGHAHARTGSGTSPSASGAAAPAARETGGAPNPPPGATPAADATPKPPPSPTVMQVQAVRSGQRVYARGRDLVVTAPVASGAEVVADGCVHVYGPLRGRAMAGAHGDANARVFAHEFRAELVSIAGIYRIFETLPPELEGQPVQAWLEGDRLRFARIGH